MESIYPKFITLDNIPKRFPKYYMLREIRDNNAIYYPKDGSWGFHVDTTMTVIHDPLKKRKGCKIMEVSFEEAKKSRSRTLYDNTQLW